MSGARPYGGETVWGQPGRTALITFGFDASESDKYFVRIHEEDAERYNLEQAIQVIPDEAGRWSRALVERLEPGPDQVCLKHNMYLENTAERERTILFKTGECTIMRLDWTEERADWKPY